jgi:hypothetical protein
MLEAPVAPQKVDKVPPVVIEAGAPPGGNIEEAGGPRGRPEGG